MTHWLIWLIKHPFSSFIYRTNSLFPIQTSLILRSSHLCTTWQVFHQIATSIEAKKESLFCLRKNWQMKWNKKISFIYLSKKRSNFFCHGAIRFAHIGMLSFSPRKNKALFISVTLSSFVFTQRTHKPTKCSLRNKLYSNSILKGVCFFCV